jgi:ParB/RepB/Spo0J family partition protein
MTNVKNSNVATRNTKAAAARTTTKTRNELTVELEKIIEPFGWTVYGHAASHLQAAELDAMSTWLDEAWTKTPLVVWSLIVIPDAQLFGARKNKNDAMAIVSTILTHRGEFAANPEDPVARLIDSINESGYCETRFGGLFLGTEPELRIWFGRKAGKPPDLSGDEARVAIQRLFNVAITAPRDEPKWPPAASVSGPKKSKRGPQTSGERKDVSPPMTVDPATGKTMQQIDIGLIVPDEANRLIDKASILQLAANIREIGLLQPITVRPIADTSPQRYMITAGERRWRACCEAGFKTIPAIIRETAGEATAVSRISENVHRENLTPSELATEYSRLLQSGMTQKKIGELFDGISQGQVSNTIRLLELPAGILKHVDARIVAPTLIRDVLSYSDLPPLMDAVEKMIATRIKSDLPIEQTSLQECLKNAIRTHSRSMSYDSGWSSYAPPDPKKRHFKTLSDEDRKALAPRNFKDLMNTWGDQERTFNVKLFGELNTKPLADRRKKHGEYKAKTHRSQASDKSQKKVVSYFDNERRVANEIADSLAIGLADVIAKHKDRATVYRIVLAIAFTSDGAIGDAILGQRRWDPDEVCKMFDKLDGTPKQIEDTIRTAVVELLQSADRPQIAIDSVLHLASLLNADLLAAWKPPIDVLNELTDAGREVCRTDLQAADAEKATLLNCWPAGYMPEFLREIVQPKPVKATKLKKGKAA